MTKAIYKLRILACEPDPAVRLLALNDWLEKHVEQASARQHVDVAYAGLNAGVPVAERAAIYARRDLAHMVAEVAHVHRVEAHGLVTFTASILVIHPDGKP